MINKGLFSSNSDNWETPLDLFERLDQEFNFDLDVCANDFNTKCFNYYTLKEDGLVQEWIGNIWCNPPYGRNIGKWVKKAYESSLNGNLVVMLLPARTDTKWFHDYIYNKSEIRFLKGRLKFSNSKASAPFPSMIVILKGSDKE